MKLPSAAFAAACFTLGAALGPAPSSAQLAAPFAKPEEAVKYRESALSLIGARFNRLRSVARGETPYDAAQVKAEVKILQMLSTLPWEAFGTGTTGGAALPEVWSDAAGFKQKQQGLAEQVARLSAAADTGDLAKVREAVGSVGESCQACHRTFRKR